jgi:hypothetical protein
VLLQIFREVWSLQQLWIRVLGGLSWSYEMF